MCALFVCVCVIPNVCGFFNANALFLMSSFLKNVLSLCTAFSAEAVLPQQYGVGAVVSAGTSFFREGRHRAGGTVLLLDFFL